MIAIALIAGTIILSLVGMILRLRMQRKSANAKASGAIAALQGQLGETGLQLEETRRQLEETRRQLEEACRQHEETRLQLEKLAERDKGMVARESKIAAAERSISEQQQRMHRIIDAAYDAFVVFDTRGKITTFSNRAVELFGVSAEEAIGKSIRTFLEYDHIIKDLSEGRPKDQSNVASCGVVESFAKNATGKCIPVEVSLSMSRFDGRPEFHAFIHDLTARNELQSRMMHLEKMESLGKLSAGLAHEFNTPMQFIGNNLEFLDSCMNELSPLLMEFRQLVDLVAPQFPDAASQLKAQCETMDLDFVLENMPQAITSTRVGIKKISRITAAMKEFANPGFSTRSAVCVDRLLDDVALVAQHVWEPIATLNLDLQATQQLFDCQPAELSQVLLSLISNACDTIREKIELGLYQRGQIWIRSIRRENALLVEIEDDGMGIPKAIQKKVYDPFFTTREVGKGMGQGLTVAHAVIVEKHQGRISFRTEEGAGTCFILSLPLASAVTQLQPA